MTPELLLKMLILLAVIAMGYQKLVGVGDMLAVKLDSVNAVLSLKIENLGQRLDKLERVPNHEH